MSTKIDFKRELKHLYNPSAREVSIVDIPAMNFLMVNGEGAPTSPQYMQSIEALFTVSYALKFMVKKVKSFDYGVMPLEGLWWTDNMNEFTTASKDKWKWTSMIMQPQYVQEADVKTAIEQVLKKKELPAINKIVFDNFHEGLAAQILYTGPYAEEGPAITKIHEYIHKNGHELSGKHHEIYLNDPSRTSPEKLKTILRQPMK
ncbi:MAG: GyrI-like domain-containing protein [Candidatus Bathyarchaeota archaeon]|nr:GyrI-like domain-containing protein [Candidatus Termiticorpusculum sp.]